ncbi:hypothetical protein [Paenibacillus wenxiniae]|uniref:Uncharacterized protein n=1 Tax=Paenibacillus wenxiniae TaxID=1636843 RepID=A0ABW4RJ80_9BACL
MSEAIREYKECVFVEGVLWNIGPWDYQYRDIQTGTDEEGQPIFEQRAMNPLPENAVIDHRWFRFTPERGWYEEGTEPVLSFNEHMNRSVTDMYALLVEKNVITIDNVPSYNEYDFKAEVQKKLSDSDA